MDNKKIGFLFDLDGVLIDSESEYSKIWATINKEYPTGVDNLEIRIKGCTLEKILGDYFPDPEVQKKVVDRLYELEGKMIYRYLPGAEELLKLLKAKGIPTALVTSSNNDKMKHLREELPGIFSYFDIIVTADLISRSKPDPEGYLKAAELLNVEIANCVVFEDSLQGVMAGKNAGAYVVGVSGTLPPKVLQPYVDRIIENLNEIKLEDISKLR